MQERTPSDAHRRYGVYVRRTFVVITCCLVVLLAAFVREVHTWMRPPTFFVFDVGQGDGLLIADGGRQIVVDGGPDGSMLSHLGRTMPFFDRTIDLLVLSHPHLDHLQSFPELLRRYNVHAALFTGADYANPRYEEFLTLLGDEGVRVIVADPDHDIVLGDLFVDVLWPPPDFFGVPLKDVNENSVALRIQAAGGKSVLLTGDMEEGEEHMMLQTGIDVSADILKVAHHGSRTSSSSGFLLAVHPDVAIASVAAENSYGLPDEDVVARFQALGIPLRMTMEEGTIVVPL